MSVSAAWRDDAACRHADPDLFFPVGATGPGRRQAAEAKRICAACPARQACLAWALEQGVTAGVWGGTTEDERRALRAHHLRARAGQPPEQGRDHDRAAS